MNAGEIISYALLGALALFTFAMSDRDGTAATQINERLSALEDNMVSRTIPQITIEGRAAVYAGSGQVVVEAIEVKK